MDTTRINSAVGRSTPAMALRQAPPSQGQLLAELLESLDKARPASGSRKPAPQEIGEALKLQGDDLARFIPLVVDATISSTGKMTLVLREDFVFKPHPDANDLVIKMALSATISPGKLAIADGLQAVAFLVRTNIQVIETATENNVRGVRIVAGLGTRFFAI